ncbi:hypothetical protein MMC15_006515 [Xylographa vitiligo]|nr:hypothetical protein [Xylographa vitiligo]
MPARGKRTLEDFDPTKSDSDDSDYDASTVRPRGTKASKIHRAKPVRKRQRTTYGGDASEDISESDVAEDSYEQEESEVELPEIDSRTGRPVRKAAKKRVAYQESDEDSEEFMKTVESAAEEESSRKNQKQQQSRILKLKVGTPQQPTRRSTRARSGSVSARRPPTAEPSSGTRRSSRIAHDDTETMVALTNSGHHADIVRVGTRSPEGIPRRALKGGKGLKRPPASAIFEDEDEASFPTKDEPEDDSHGQGSRTIETEIAASREDFEEDSEDHLMRENSDNQKTTQGDTQEILDIDGTAVVPESGDDAAVEDEEDEDPIKKPQRSIRGGVSAHVEERPATVGNRQEGRSQRRALRSAANPRQDISSQRSKKRGVDESSDFEPGPDEGAEENISDSADSESSPRKTSQQNDEDDSSNTRRSRRLGKVSAISRPGMASDEHDSEVADELAEELEDLRSSRPRRTARADILFEDRPQRRKRKPVDYRILRPDLNLPMEDDGPPTATTPSKRGRGGAGAWQRSLFSTYGPFGGAGGPPPVFGGPGGIGAAGGVDSDSSDDENMQHPRTAGIGGIVGMTPTSGAPPGFGLFPPAQVHGVDALQAPSGTPANLGRIKDKAMLADADPLGVDQNVNFDSVGGLQGHIDSLKEMVALPLLYPEIFQRFHVTPPRGVLFHGPPGTGKTLLARALASSVSSQGRKVTFYMRKGADALSKWVGEAERQLRLLFEEARKTQPSIIFFDEIDGLAPVRSSKQEQIHASIVSTLLALMDGMDGRGQVIVIGATNRPDSIDPALRRPGRFDREFYFPLPNTEGRRKILDIHTKGWEPPVPDYLKDDLAELTKGYGGADLRALCTEAALNAVQRRYPQIYTSNEKLEIKPETISIAPKDFMISIKQMIPSSERAASSGAAPLPKTIEPLLREPLAEIKNILADVLPQKKLTTALEEAQYEDAEGDGGMTRERMQQEFERSRVFRPRLLIRGIPGMGQQYLAGALLNHFEGLHIQSFDLPTLLSDSGRSAEAAVVQLFTEVRRHKPSVIYIPNVDIWYRTLEEKVISTFLGLLRSIPPTDPVLLLGVLEGQETEDERDANADLVKRLFGFSKRNQFELQKPSRTSRLEFFIPIIDYLNTSPEDFPDPTDRKKRVFETLRVVPPPPPKEPEPATKEELKAQKKKDRQTLNILKLRIQPIMEQIRLKFKRFRTGVIDESQIRYLYDEEDHNIVVSDLPHEDRQLALFRPFEKGTDDSGEPGLVDQASGKFFYNMEIVTIEKRLSNGYYKRPKDFLVDIKKMTKDAKAIGDADRLLKANELQANVEVDIGMIETDNPALAAECEAVYIRERKREEEKVEKAKQAAAAEGRQPEPILSNVPPRDLGTSAEDSSGAIMLGQATTNGILHPITPSRPSLPSTLTNGLSGNISDLSNLQGHHESNGTSVPSRGEDLPMTNSDDTSTNRETQSSWGPSAQTRPLSHHTGGPASLQQRLSYPGSLSQRSAITPMAEGSNPNMYSNDASSTSSDKRMTGSSGALNTQSTHQGRLEGPDLSIIPGPPSAHSQLPDTQGMQPSASRMSPELRLISPIGDPSSQGSTQKSNSNSSQSQLASQSSHPPVPPFSKPSGIPFLLNASPPTTPAHPPLVTEQAAANAFLHELVKETSACSVEQLEQVYSALMSELWRTRGQWNRVGVVDGMRGLLRDVLDDMMDCQDFGPGSMELLQG